MDKIEASLKLPADADPIDRYSRYYAKLPDGKITAIYIIHPEGWSEEEVRQNCIEHDVSGFPCGPDGRVELVSAGKRKWVNDYLSLPFMHGGGCGQINIGFDADASIFTEVECNGPY